MKLSLLVHELPSNHELEIIFQYQKKKGRKIKNREETLPLFDTIRAFFCVAMIIRLVAMNWMDIIDIESGKQRNEERESERDSEGILDTADAKDTYKLTCGAGLILT